MKFKFMDPKAIITIVVCLVVMAVGAYAMFTTLTALQNAQPKWKAGSGYYGSYLNASNKSIINATSLGGQVFNILGIVIMIGAIMSIIGIIYSYIRPGY